VSSSDRVTCEGYFQEAVPGIRAGREESTGAGTSDSEPDRVTRRCTTCGRKGHNASNSAVHPHLTVRS
jgi:hypothetical protein